MRFAFYIAELITLLKFEVKRYKDLIFGKSEKENSSAVLVQEQK